MCRKLKRGIWIMQPFQFIIILKILQRFRVFPCSVLVYLVLMTFFLQEGCVVGKDFIDKSVS